ncbi:lipoma-preferred partner homolog isoform X1 [Hydra vulgaris]|uniref:Lipoma-preferred partner n=1 Tax=Hydra vulgaris TaxID=6087 RepID=T2M836_HYDVU|nr:lipoma-preferred partner homolog [Hydra vulgaris]
MLKFQVEKSTLPKTYTVGCDNGRESQVTSSVKFPVRQHATKAVKVPPPVKAKPVKPSDIFSSDAEIHDFPPPPPGLTNEFPEPPPSYAPSSRSSIEDELDALTDMLALGLESASDPDFFGVCYKCRQKISGEGNGCTALENTYHVSCFVCQKCKKKLTGHEFYCLDNQPNCEDCYKNTLEDCVVCKEKITERILRAVGSCYHPSCFTCSSCNKNLDSIPFTLDAANAIHCVECYQLKFSPRCAFCQKLIKPTNQRGETVHIVSMQKNFHVECYKCEDCDELLSSEEGRGCYPLDGRLLCQSCNGAAQARKSNGSRLSTVL